MYEKVSKIEDSNNDELSDHSLEFTFSPMKNMLSIDSAIEPQ